jgi:hypothetical protein
MTLLEPEGPVKARVRRMRDTQEAPAGVVLGLIKGLPK